MPASPCRLAPLLLLLLLAACRPGGGDAPAPAQEDPGVAAAPAEPGPPPGDGGEDFEATWTGVLPCADCDGIETRLTLSRAGGEARFELEERYLGAAGTGTFLQAGAWEARRDEDGQVTYRLDPAGSDQRWRTLPDGGLEGVYADGRPLSEGPDFRLGRL